MRSELVSSSLTGTLLKERNSAFCIVSRGVTRLLGGGSGDEDAMGGVVHGPDKSLSLSRDQEDTT